MRQYESYTQIIIIRIIIKKDKIKRRGEMTDGRARIERNREKRFFFSFFFLHFSLRSTEIGP